MILIGGRFAALAARSEDTGRGALDGVPLALTPEPVRE
jgi:hypothetical protein